MRREFSMPPIDVEYLDGTGLEWETIVQDRARWLLIHGRGVRPGFEPERVTVALQILPGYPDSQLDMVWFHPPLAPKGKQVVRALSTQTIDGKAFQRWSRHRTATNAWRPGLDDVCTHLILVDHWLAKEVA